MNTDKFVSEVEAMFAQGWKPRPDIFILKSTRECCAIGAAVLGAVGVPKDHLGVGELFKICEIHFDMTYHEFRSVSRGFFGIGSGEQFAPDPVAYRVGLRLHNRYLKAQQ